MEFIANSLNTNFLSNVLPSEEDDVDYVLAAIAYGSDSSNEERSLLGNCLRNNLKLDIWMRYDHTVPVSVSLLRKLLNSHSRNVYCRLIPDYLHSKLIWWKGYGAYIGSANLTDKAWLTNIETGIFLTEEEIVSNSLDLQFEDFFDKLNSLDKSFPLTQEIIEEMAELTKLRVDLREKGKEKRSIPEWNGPANYDKKKAVDRKKENFRSEWHETLTILRDIGFQLNDYRPKWVDESVPNGWHTDQFLHAYYYNRVSEGRSKPFEQFYQRNSSDPQRALKDSMLWWKELSEPPSNEDKNLYTNAPFLQKNLSEENINELDLEIFETICKYTHATLDHILKIRLSTLGRTNVTSLPKQERIPLFASWLWNQTNSKGWRVKQLLKYILYDGKEEDMWERLYQCGRTEELRISHYGLNSLAEVAGWVKPHIAPPRNGRTSKALKALGFYVNIY